MLFSMLLALCAIARADEPATPDEVQDSGDADPLAIARQAFDKATAQQGSLAGLRTKNTEQDRAIESLRQRISKLEGEGASDAEIATAKAELEKLVQEVKTSAATAKTEADRAKAEADRARREADRAETAAVTAPPASTHSLDSAPAPNRDNGASSVYASVGVGVGWMFREPVELVDPVTMTEYLETTELSSGMLGVPIEVGWGNFGPKRRLNAGLRGTSEYNVGGGWAFSGEFVFGGFVEQTHVFRLEGSLGVSWETIPGGVVEYQDRRWLLGVGAELVPVEGWGVLLTGRGLPDNDLEGGAAGEAAVAVRKRF